MPRSKTVKKPAATPDPSPRKGKASAELRAAPAVRRNVKTSEVVALDIVRDIVARKLKPGDKLPLEADLLKQYRVSRSSLREALRLLEVQGLITIRPGPGGGAVVDKAQPASLGRTLSLHMHLVGATYDELLDTWVLTEATLAEMAAKNPDRDAVRRAMEPFIDAQSTAHGHEIQEGLEFHMLIGDLTGNRVLSFLLLMIGTIITEHIVTTVDRQALEDHIVHDHAAVARAIIAGNPKKSHQLMREHIERIADYFREYWPRKVGEKIQWR